MLRTFITQLQWEITLLSDSSLNTFPTNKQSDFTVRLDHRIYLDKDGWEVVLVEIITPPQVMNISEENFFFLAFLDQRILKWGENSVTEMCTVDKYKLFIPAQQLAEEIQ